MTQKTKKDSKKLVHFMMTGSDPEGKEYTLSSWAKNHKFYINGKRVKFSEYKRKLGLNNMKKWFEVKFYVELEDNEMDHKLFLREFQLPDKHRIAHYSLTREEDKMRFAYFPLGGATGFAEEKFKK